ncbi:hypothetical protein EVJ58_g831 [Rhodofomes roseus]|uniref:Uncharacterized protein n=1 Tax=Rhodofomes roseus TaxID=34475 RepID=A0A4Y9Z4L7_9APHY|nr:hypothetical protein EVJ58_g831 [Rhodofomes roseus]
MTANDRNGAAAYQPAMRMTSLTPRSFGSFFIGTTIATALYGCVCAQLIYYLKRYSHRDGKIMRSLGSADRDEYCVVGDRVWLLAFDAVGVPHAIMLAQTAEYGAHLEVMSLSWSVIYGRCCKNRSVCASICWVVRAESAKLAANSIMRSTVRRYTLYTVLRNLLAAYDISSRRYF